MQYDKFVGAISWTKAARGIRKHKPDIRCKKYQDFSYAALRARGDDYWLHLEKMNAADLGEEIIDCFLNKWKCRLPKPSTEKGKELTRNLKNAVDKLPEHYASLKGFRLEGMRFDEGNLWVIDQIYSIFCQIEPKFGAVPASKLMHMALPGLFVMWDDDIIKEYGLRKQVLPYFGRQVRSYTAFLILMQENVRHIKQTSPMGSSMTHDELFREINAQLGEKGLPIARLLDMANFAISRRRITYQKCDECIEVARQRVKTMRWYSELAKPKYPFFG